MLVLKPAKRCAVHIKRQGCVFKVNTAFTTICVPRRWRLIHGAAPIVFSHLAAGSGDGVGAIGDRLGLNAPVLLTREGRKDKNVRSEF